MPEMSHSFIHVLFAHLSRKQGFHSSKTTHRTLSLSSSAAIAQGRSYLDQIDLNDQWEDFILYTTQDWLSN